MIYLDDVGELRLQGCAHAGVHARQPDRVGVRDLRRAVVERLHANVGQPADSQFPHHILAAILAVAASKETVASRAERVSPEGAGPVRLRLCRCPASTSSSTRACRSSRESSLRESTAHAEGAMAANYLRAGPTFRGRTVTGRRRFGLE